MKHGCIVRLSIAAEGGRFQDGPDPVFLLGDTAWSAFSRAGISEWRAYLRRRARQGFNVVYVSVLPIVQDRSCGADDREPFCPDEHRGWDLDRLDEKYLARAGEMVEIAAEEGMAAALVLLWCDYVPGGARGTGPTVFSEAQTRAYLDRAVSCFAPYRPIFVISGDDYFDDGETVGRYRDALHQVKAAAPDCLTTMHHTPDAVLPEVLTTDPDLDFYAYQSGHDYTRQDLCWTLAERYRGYQDERPVVNMEPCYEGSGYNRGAGRFRAEDVRFASWASVLGGASAGLGYGAHGVFSWHRPGDRFLGESFSGTPFPVDVALGFPGAVDAGFIRHVVEDNGLYAMVPRQDLLRSPVAGVRIGATGDLSTIIVYARHPFGMELAHDLAGYRRTLWDLPGRTRQCARLSGQGQHTLLEQPEFLGDALYLFTADV